MQMQMLLFAALVKKYTWTLEKSHKNCYTQIQKKICFRYFYWKQKS